MDATRIFFADYLIRGSVPPGELGSFINQVVTDEPNPQLALGNIAAGIFEGMVMSNEEYSETYYLTQMKRGRVDDDDPGWAPVESEDVAVSFSSPDGQFERRINKHNETQVIFQAGLVAIKGLIHVPGVEAACPHVAGGFEIPTGLTLTLTEEGTYNTRVQLRHQEFGLLRPDNIISLHTASVPTAIAS